MAPLVANVNPVRVWTTWKEPSAALVYHLTKDLSVGQAVASMFNGAIHYTPVSDALHAVLHPMFRTTFASETAYDLAFDRTEILLAVLAQDVELQLGRVTHTSVAPGTAVSHGATATTALPCP